MLWWRRLGSWGSCWGSFLRTSKDFAFLLKFPIDGEFSQEHNAGQNREMPLVGCCFEALAIGSQPIPGSDENKIEGGRYAHAAD